MNVKSHSRARPHINISSKHLLGCKPPCQFAMVAVDASANATSIQTQKQGIVHIETEDRQNAVLGAVF